MTLSETDILQILRMVEESSFGELRLETGDVKLIVRKKGCNGSVAEPCPSAETAAQPTPQPVVDQAAGCSALAQPKKESPKEALAPHEDSVPINAPILGTFYRRPSPDAQPYVEIGSFVKEDDTVCLIEVMKVFTAVKAGVRGHIREILVENNSMVEYGQPLFWVKPETTSPG